MRVIIRGIEAEYHPTISSTNDRCLALGHTGAAHGMVVIADAQTGGRGRMQREWLSPAGQNIYMSVLLRPDIALKDAPMITLACGVASAEAIERITGVRVMLKWPNDLFTESGRKLGGILVESHIEGGRLLYAVAGIGINVNQTAFPPVIKDIAGSLMLETSREHERELIASKVAEAVLDEAERFEPQGIIARWSGRSYLTGRHVRVDDAGRVTEGTALGIDDKGRLMVQRADGSVAHVVAGDVG